MTTAQLPFRADIAGAMPPTMMKDVEGLLGTSSRLLGMYEAYKAFAVQSERFEPPLESDEITIAMLEDIHERAASVVEDAEIVADRGHTDGFVAMMRMTINDVVPSLEDLRGAWLSLESFKQRVAAMSSMELLLQTKVGHRYRIGVNDVGNVQARSAS